MQIVHEGNGKIKIKFSKYFLLILKNVRTCEVGVAELSKTMGDYKPETPQSHDRVKELDSC